MTDTAGLMHILQICDSLFPQWVRSRFQTGLKPTFSMISSLPKRALKNISILTSQCCPTMSLVRRQRHTMLTKRSFAVLMRYTLRRKHHLRYEAAQKRSQRRFFKICNNGQESFTGLYKSLTEQGICKGHQCIAYGLYMRDNGIELSEGLAVYGYSICSAIVTNCVKLVPL